VVALSNYLENALINVTLRNTAYTAPATVYVSLHTADSAETGASEVTGGSYARQAAAFSAPSNGATSNTGAITFTSMPAVTVTHVGIWDASTAGNLLYAGALTASKTLNSGDTFTIPVGDLDVALS
jgi:hypothetical protein